MRVKSSIEHRCLEFLFKARGCSQFDLDFFLERKAKRLCHLLRDLLNSFKHLKFQVALNVNLGKQTITEERHVSIKPWFVSNAQTCYACGSKRKLLKALREILQFFDAFLEQGSVWSLE